MCAGQGELPLPGLGHSMDPGRHHVSPPLVETLLGHSVYGSRPLLWERSRRGREKREAEDKEREEDKKGEDGTMLDPDERER